MDATIRTGPTTDVGAVVCPTDADLFSFAEGRLAESASDSVFRHLSQCGRCEQSLERLSEQHNSEWRTRSSQAAQGQPTDPTWLEPECQRMQQAVRELASRMLRGIEAPGQGSTDSTRLSTDHHGGAKVESGAEATTAYVPTALRAIGRYQVRSPLGEGAYGRVYLAHDPQLDRQVAIKVAKFGPNVRPALIDAFLREAKIAARLKHVGIVAVHDAGFDPQAGCFIVMEFVAGRSLKQILGAGRVTPDQAARFVAQAAEAVHYAHKQGLVHRDIKPANLLIDSENQVKVADFGLALLEEQQRSQAGEFAGTLAYCSPEQVRGEVHHLDGRTDIWSLGVIFYELLTGRRPFGGPGLSSEILERPPKPPRQIDDSIPPHLEQVCLRCLEKDVSARYLTARDLTAALQSPSPVAPRASLHFSLGGVSITVVVSTVLLALLVGAGIYTSLTSAGRENRSRAIEPPTVPYQVDERPLRVPVHLALGRPRLMFPLNEPNEDWRLLQAEESLRLDGPATILLGLGKTNSAELSMRTNLSKSARLGLGGWFLGFKPRTDFPEQWECEFVGLHCAAPDDFRITRVEYYIKPKGDRFLFNSRTVASVQVSAIDVKDCELEVKVRSGRVAEVRWQGQILPKLTDRERHPPASAMDARGEFGVMNIAGSTVFQEPTFKRER